MLFQSANFLLFFLIVLGLYHFLKDFRLQNRLLIVASCLFYGAWNFKCLAIMFLSISVDYFCSKFIYRARQRSQKRALLFISIFVNLSILIFFKYFNFFVTSTGELLRAFDVNVPWVNSSLNILLPLGISFYTFEAISYVVDVYKEKTPPAQNYWDYVSP